MHSLCAVRRLSLSQVALTQHCNVRPPVSLRSLKTTTALQHHTDMHGSTEAVVYCTLCCLQASSQGSTELVCVHHTVHQKSVVPAGRQSYPGTVRQKDCGWPLRKEAQLQLCGCMHLPAAHHDWSLCTPACGVLLYIGHLAGGIITFRMILNVHCLFKVTQLACIEYSTCRRFGKAAS